MRICKFQWDATAQAMKLLPRFRRIAADQFEDGHEYPLEVRESRSSRSHAYFFAAVSEAHANLNEEATAALKTPTHLRRWALITAGWYDETLIDAGEGELGKQRAMQMAAMARRLDDYAEIKVIHQGEFWFLRVRTAKSQSLSAMGKDEFEKSKRDVLDILAGQINVTRKELERAGKVSAA